MKYGFMLIELIVATLIASMIGTLLLTALSQGTRFQRSIDTMVDTSLRVGIASHQLEKDFMGAFIPMQARLKEEKEEETEESAGEKKEGAEKKSSDQTKEPKKTEEKPTKTSKPAEKPIEKIFYGTNKDGHLDILTFITNNPLTVFVGKDVGVVKPKMVRVQYSLKPEDEKEKKSDTFVLMRQESTEIDLAKYTNVRSYELIGGIKECTITYTARIKKEDEQAKKAAAKAGQEKTAEKAPAAQKEKVQYEYRVQSEWISEQKEETSKKPEEQEESAFPRIPYMIELKMSLWDMQHSKTEEFVLTWLLPTDFSVVKQEEKKENKDTQKKDASEKKEKGAEDKEKQGQQVALNKEAENLSNSLSTALSNITKMFGKM